MSSDKGTVFVPGGPPFIYGKKNVAYQGPSSAQGSTDASKGTASSASSDFDNDTTEKSYVMEADYSTDVDMSWISTDEQYLEHRGIDPSDNVDYHIDWGNDPFIEEEIENQLYFARENVINTVEEWSDAFDDDIENVLIKGNGIGWMRKEGYKIVSMKELLDDPIGTIQPNTSDISQTWKNDNGVLTAVQSHHDAPTGETYEFYPMRDEEIHAFGEAMQEME